MKTARHARIREIIEKQVVETQEELATALKKQGFDVTQATVSRDIKELMLIKIPTDNNKYRYAFSADQGPLISQSRIARIFQETVLRIDASANIIVIRTMVGGAQPIAHAIDVSKWPKILGTVAGDDTIFVVVAPPEAVNEVIGEFKKLMG